MRSLRRVLVHEENALWARCMLNAAAFGGDEMGGNYLSGHLDQQAPIERPAESRGDIAMEDRSPEPGFCLLTPGQLRSAREAGAATTYRCTL